jgi:hypothetical protein
MVNVSDKHCRENPNIHFMSSAFFFRKYCRIWDSKKKYCRAGQATENNMAHARRMLDVKGCKYTLSLCYTSCFSTATIVARTRLDATLIRTLPVFFMLIILCIVNQFQKSSNKMTHLYSILLFPASRSTCFGWNIHPSSGARLNCIYSIWCWQTDCDLPSSWMSRML